nr:type IV pilus assembly protein PilF [uncultured Gammaproteobacteria bacterium]
MRHFWVVGIAWIVAACVGSAANSRQKLSLTYAEKGAAYLAEGNLEVAAQDLNKSLELDPNNAAAHSTLALLYERLGDQEKALAHHQAAVKLLPSDPGIVGNFGRFLCHQGRFQEGLEFLKRALRDRLYVKRWIPLTNAGECALKAGKLEEAEEYLREALSSSENPLALSGLVKLYFLKQDYLKARAFLQRYEALGAPEREMLELGEKIESALGDRQAADSYRRRLAELGN